MLLLHALMGCKADNITQNYIICYNITFYRKIFIETLHSKINTSSSIVVILSMDRTFR